MFPTRNLFINQHVPIPKLDEKRENIDDFFKVDVAGNKAMPLNYGGWFRSDLAVLNAANDISVAKSLANSLVELPDGTSGNVGLTDEEIILQARSKYNQTPSEMTRYIEQQIEFRDEQIVAVQRAAAQRAAAAAHAKEINDLKDSLTPEEREEVRSESRKNQIKKLVKK